MATIGIIFEQFVGPVRCWYSATGRCAADWGYVHGCRGRYRDGGTCGELSIDCRAGPLSCCRDELNEVAFERAQDVRHG